MTLKEKIAVMQAADEGKKIQRALIWHSSSWVDDSAPIWDWETYLYRVKPEPREWWEIRATGVVVLHPMSFDTRAKAEAAIMSCSGSVELVHVREVLP